MNCEGQDFKEYKGTWLLLGHESDYTKLINICCKDYYKSLIYKYDSNENKIVGFEGTAHRYTARGKKPIKIGNNNSYDTLLLAGPNITLTDPENYSHTYKRIDQKIYDSITNLITPQPRLPASSSFIFTNSLNKNKKIIYTIKNNYASFAFYDTLNSIPVISSYQGSINDLIPNIYQ
ncbi:MAG: hypothetical protein SGJ10_10200 [Bacteroidota bacterium]|nr:hypothetical protein [Bacteroidota bacterium]